MKEIASPNIETASRLEQWLRHHLPEAGRLQVVNLRMPTTGFSAKTLVATVTGAGPAGAERRIVVRIDKPGHDIFLDADLEKQGGMMRELERRGIPVPHVIGAERDQSILGGAFLAMDFVDGHVLPQHPSYKLAGFLFESDRARRRRVWTGAVETLAHINRLDWRDGFAFLDNPARGAPGLRGYLDWVRAWRVAAAGETGLPIIDEAMDYLSDELPDHPQVDLLWGDCSAGNMIFANDGALAAAVDFEAAALGPAEIDLGWWLFMDEMQEGPLLDGVPTRDEQIALYERALGRTVRALSYFEVLAATRMCLVVVNAVNRVVNAGLLRPDTRAATDNPLIGLLALKLGLKPPEMGSDFAEFRGVMTSR